jgi:hypothetical protein
MAAGQGFKTFATGDVLTAADTNGYLMSQTVMVFADSSARSAAITSPQQGMVTFLKGTNSTEYYSGSAWVAIGAAASSALTLVKTVSFSGASSVDLSNSFSATYDQYTVQGSFTASASADLLFRYRVSGADDSTTNYNYQLADIDGTSSNNARLTGQTSGRLCATRASSVRSSFKTEMYQPFASTTKQWVGHSSVLTDGTTYTNQISGGWNSTTSFTGLTIYPSSGTITGNIRIYGYQNS